MSEVQNEHGQIVGPPLTNWHRPERPVTEALTGRWCILQPLDPERDAVSLFQETAAGPASAGWTYLPDNAPSSPAAFREWAMRRCSEPSSLAYVIVDPVTSAPRGTLSYLRIDPPNGCIEIGFVIFAPSLQRSTPATEAVFLLLKYAFALGYRRVEWKCDALNSPSRRAAERFGFTFEGVFRQAVVTKGRNRDTAWYSMLDCEWPALRPAYESWLEPGNFDSAGRQRARLSDFIAVSRTRDGY